jgi:predicted HD phosphohydrolase
MKRSEQFCHLLEGLQDVYDSGDRAAVDQYEHSLQVATRAVRAGADTEFVVVAMLHDVFRILAPATHGEAIAEALGDRLSTDRYHILAFHGVWQHDVVHGTNHTEDYKHESWYADACRLGQWDADSFDPTYPSLDISELMPFLEEFVD